MRYVDSFFCVAFCLTCLSPICCSAYQLPIRHTVLGWEDSILFSNMRAPNRILKALRLHRKPLLVLQSDNNRIIMYSVLVPNCQKKMKEDSSSKDQFLCSAFETAGCVLLEERMMKESVLNKEVENDEYILEYDLLCSVCVDGPKRKAICIAMMRAWFFYCIQKDLQTSCSMTSTEFLSWVESESHMPSAF